MACDGKLSAAQVDQFNRDGYLIVEDFLSHDEVQGLRDRMQVIVEELDLSDHPKTIFSTTNQTRDDFFITSGDKIRAFFEEGVFDEKGELTVEKSKSINKIGHALHVLDPVFKDATFSTKVQNVATAVGFVDPIIPQSMYIFKQPNIGGLVTPHQDLTFLHVEPRKLVGFWYALEDCTIENACLWFIPGSHTNGVKQFMVRNPLYGKQPGESAILFTGEKPLVDCDDKDFIPGEVKKGTLVLIHGEVVHKSEPNVSSKSRHIYTFHVVESHNTEWKPENWLQPTQHVPFPHLLTGKS